MKQFLEMMFSESSSVSNMRILATLCVFTGCIIAVAATLAYIFAGKQPEPLAIISGSLIVSGLGAKWAQKKDEAPVAIEQPKA